MYNLVVQSNSNQLCKTGSILKHHKLVHDSNKDLRFPKAKKWFKLDFQSFVSVGITFIYTCMHGGICLSWLAASIQFRPEVVARYLTTRSTRLTQFAPKS